MSKSRKLTLYLLLLTFLSSLKMLGLLILLFLHGLSLGLGLLRGRDGFVFEFLGWHGLLRVKLNYNLRTNDNPI